MRDKLVVVTGGASGIGRSIVKLALERNCRVAVFDMPSSALNAIAKEHEGMPVSLHGVDVTKEEDVAREVDVVAKTGPIYGLVNCAGIGQSKPFSETTVEEFRNILDVNVVGSFVVAREVVRHMNNGGVIVNITSVSGIQGSIGRTAYGASKGAVNTMTRILAVELAEQGIRVNAIAPGPVETPMAAKWHDTKMRETWTSRVPLRRYGSIEEIASMTLVMLDDTMSGYVTGQVVAVDGGFCAAGLME